MPWLSINELELICFIFWESTKGIRSDSIVDHLWWTILNPHIKIVQNSNDYMHHFINIKVHDNPSHPYDQDTNIINVGLIKKVF